MTGRAPSPDEPSIPDEVWQQFVQDSEAEIRRSAPKEPSARARQVTERLRQHDAEAARATSKGRRWGRRKPAPATPPGWRTGPAWAEMDGRAARRRRIRGLIGVLLVVGLVVLVMRPSLVLSRIPGGAAAFGGAAPSPTLPPETAPPTAAPSEEAFPDTPTLKQPFAGSPAQRWEDGEKAIELPAAHAVGHMTAKQVAFALEKTKEYLLGTNLDPAVLRGAKPTAAEKLVDPIDSGWHKDLRAAFAEPGKRQDPLWYASRFQPSEIALVGDVVKVRGRMTYAKGEYGSVRIHADYTFVYPVRKAAAGSTEVTRTIVRRVLDVQVGNPAYVQVTAGKLRLMNNEEDASNSACGVYDGFLHPQFQSDLATDPSSPTGPTTDPYDRSKAIDHNQQECGTVSRV